jgi:hypothetical protein
MLLLQDLQSQFSNLSFPIKKNLYSEIHVLLEKTLQFYQAQEDELSPSFSSFLNTFQRLLSLFTLHYKENIVLKSMQSSLIEKAVELVELFDVSKYDKEQGLQPLLQKYQMNSQIS